MNKHYDRGVKDDRVPKQIILDLVNRRAAAYDGDAEAVRDAGASYYIYQREASRQSPRKSPMSPVKYMLDNMGLNYKDFRNKTRRDTVSLDYADMLCCALGTHLGLEWAGYWKWPYCWLLGGADEEDA